MRNYDPLSEDEIKEYDGSYRGIENDFPVEVLNDFVSNTIKKETGLPLDFRKYFDFYPFVFTTDAIPAEKRKSVPRFHDAKELEAMVQQDMPGARVLGLIYNKDQPPSVLKFSIITPDGKTYGYDDTFKSGPIFTDYDKTNLMFNFYTAGSYASAMNVDYDGNTKDTTIYVDNAGIIITKDKSSSPQSIHYILPDEPDVVHSLESYDDLIGLLQQKKSAPGLDDILATAKIHDIQSVEQLRTLVALLPPDSNAWADLITTNVAYGDTNEKIGGVNEYANPVLTLLS